MKKITIYLLAAISFITANAEVKSGETVDTALVTVVFDHKVIDTVINKENLTPEAILIGKDFVIQESWGSVLADKEISLLPEEVQEMKTYEDINKVFHIRAKHKGHSAFILKDLAKNELTHKQMISGDQYLYTESIPDFNWQIEDVVSDTIIGYPCKKASCRFRGRDWNVWFTEEIPISQGPWKFAGLPGMILKAVDGTGTHFWTATQITDEKFPIEKPLEEYARKHYFKTTRDRFWKYYKDACMRPMSMLINSGVIEGAKNEDGTPVKVKNRRRHYNPEELE